MKLPITNSSTSKDISQSLLYVGMSRNANMKGSEIKSPYFGFKPEFSIGQGNSTLINFFQLNQNVLRKKIFDHFYQQFLTPLDPDLGVERNRKQEFGSFQELLDLVPATFSPTCSAGPLFVLTSCFIYRVIFLTGSFPKC